MLKFLKTLLKSPDLLSVGIWRLILIFEDSGKSWRTVSHTEDGPIANAKMWLEHENMISVCIFHCGEFPVTKVVCVIALFI